MRKPQAGDMYMGNWGHAHFKNMKWLMIIDDERVKFLFGSQWFTREDCNIAGLAEYLNDPSKYVRLT